MFEKLKNLFKKKFASTELQETAGVRRSVMPKITDFPRTKYSAHWEVVPMQDTTIVRIYSNKGKLLTYSTFMNKDNQNPRPLDVRMSEWLKTKMESYKV